MGIDAFDGWAGINKKEVTLDANGLSDTFEINGQALAGVLIPAGMVGTSLTFQVNIDGKNWVDMADDSNALLTVTIGSASRYYSLRRILPFALGNVRVKSSSTSDAGKKLILTGQGMA